MDVANILAQCDEIIKGVKDMVDHQGMLENTIDKHELEQDLLDHWLTKFVEEEDADTLMQFVEQYLQYRENLNVKDSVENTVDGLGLEDEEETKDD